MDFIFDPSLALYLPLYELGGDSIMSRDAYGHLGTVTGAVLYPGRGRLFDGTDDVIDFGDLSASMDPGTGGLYVGYWIYPQAKAADYIGNVNLGAPDGNARFQTVFHAGKYQIYTNSAWNDTGIVPTLNTWSYIEWVRADGTLKLFVNTEDMGWSMAHAVALGPFNSVKVGRHVNTLAGLMSDVIFTQRGLTRIEGQNIYLATKWRYQ